jgi:NAD(P)-dependent dehydrogenase (short-subunit alcohol dehydrogenase family)
MSQNLFDLTDQVALITGGSGVLGMVFAHALADQGAQVVIADIDEERCTACAAQITDKSKRKSFGVLLDVSDPQAVTRAADRTEATFGRLDILINNAAAQPPGMFSPLEEYSVDVWNKVMAVNLTGQFLMSRAVAPMMLRQKKGSIVNISSVYGVVGPNQHIYEGSQFNTPPVYSASKAGVLGLTRYLATYWADKGIRVNSITPGGVFRDHKDPFLKNYCARVPMGRMAEQDELRGAVVYLASGASSYVTGHNLIVDGGWTVW